MINKLTGIWLIIVLVVSTLGTQGCTPVIIAGTLAGAGTSVAMDRRKMAKMIEDQAIEMQATDSIYSNRQLAKQVRVSVTSYNGVVLLTGEAPTEAMKNAAQSAVESLRNVRKIINEIKIAAPTSLANRSNDAWITTKIKARLANNDAFNTHAKVITSGGIVYLMGLVNPEESIKITQIIERTKGIDGFVTLFEPIDPTVPLNNTTLMAKESEPTTTPNADPQGAMPEPAPNASASSNPLPLEQNTAEPQIPATEPTQIANPSPTSEQDISDEDDITILFPQNPLQMSSE